MNDTIAAIATPTGVGAIAIVRVSGKKALDIAKKITKKDNFTPRVATLSKIYVDNKLIDEAIVIYFKAPKSFTGEDIVEFQTHGGILIAQEILKEITKEARIANPGEFSKRAFLNGKIDLTKAEAIAKIIEAKSLDALKALSKHLRGDLENFLEEIRSKLIEIIAYTEVSIDYAEEIEEDTLTFVEKRLDEVIKKVEKLIIASKQKEGLINGFKIAIIGRPNVGKSSLLNALINEERAIVSQIEGTTRDTIEEEIRIGSHLVKIIDTAGIRKKASDEIEKIGIERSKKTIEKADIILALFDISNEFHWWK